MRIMNLRVVSAALALVIVPLLLTSCIDVSQSDDPIFGTYTYRYYHNGELKIDRYRIDFREGETTDEGSGLYSGYDLDDKTVEVQFFHSEHIGDLFFWSDMKAGYVVKTTEKADGYYNVYIYSEDAAGNFDGCAYRIPSSITSWPSCYDLLEGSGKS